MSYDYADVNLPAGWFLRYLRHEHLSSGTYWSACAQSPSRIELSVGDTAQEAMSTLRKFCK